MPNFTPEFHLYHCIGLFHNCLGVFFVIFRNCRIGAGHEKKAAAETEDFALPVGFGPIAAGK